MSQDQNQNQYHGKQIVDIVHTALQSGDLSRLKDLGPAVQGVVQDVQNAVKPAVSQAPDGSVPVQPPQAQRPLWHGYNKEPGAAKPPGMKLPSGMVQMALGITGAVVFGLCALLTTGVSLALSALAQAWALCAGFGVAALASAAVAGMGAGTRRLSARLRQYLVLLEAKKVQTFEALAAATGIEPKRIRGDIRRARTKGLLPKVMADADETCVMLGEDTYQHYLESEKARRDKEEAEQQSKQLLANPETAEIERFRAEGNATIGKIRKANDAIAGEAISEKLERLEHTTARIFSYVQAHPEKLPDTRQFMNYYLPTTLKLVEKYKQYNEMEFQPQNVKEAKEDIETTLGTIDTAFNNLLESLYQHDTLDVSTDIVVLQRMLEQEGLTGKNPFATKD